MQLLKKRYENEEESYFVSMTDMMVGMLFIFIIMLMAFAMNYKDAEQTREEMLEALTKSYEARAEMLESIKTSLRDKGIIVEIDIENGILRLPESILFDSNEYILKKQAKENLKQLSNVIWSVLPCYSNYSKKLKDLECKYQTTSKLDAVFVEGHTDLTGSHAYNLNLSVNRSINTYNEMIKNNPNLLKLTNKSGEYLFSVTGYGETRPISKIHKENRRIDLRFLMSSPRPKDLSLIEGKL